MRVSTWCGQCTSTSAGAQMKEVKWCLCLPFHVYRLIQQNDLLFCLTLVHFDIILLERQCKKHGPQKLVDCEIRGFQEELATFIMDEVLSADGSFSITQLKKYKKQYDKYMCSIYYCNIYIFHCNRNICNINLDGFVMSLIVVTIGNKTYHTKIIKIN
jgi:hypothetical protein